MTGIRDFLRKRDRLRNEKQQELHPQSTLPDVTIVRSDTNTLEILNPPSFGSGVLPMREGEPNLSRPASHNRSASTTSKSSQSSHGEGRLSSMLHFRSRSRDKSTSPNLPVNLPSIGPSLSDDPASNEAQWEARATALARGSAGLGSQSRSSGSTDSREKLGRSGRSPSPRTSIGDAQGDDDIQEAIRLHESGDLKASTGMFARLADPRGANNALSQVLYGLALRHGWGVSVDLPLAIRYLSMAAENSSLIESQALASGIKKGGAAKGELVLAIFELGNCFRNGWGVDKDPVAARNYYETAAHCGDTDAMVEAARCYEEGFGVKKDKYKAASYYRKAEKKGNKIIGNSWIWKEKYNEKPDEE